MESVDNLLYYIFMFRKIFQSKIEKIKIFSDKYRLYVTPAVLIIGFLGDILTLNRVDQVFDNIILITHLLIIGSTITLLFLRDTRFGERFHIRKHANKIQYLMVFSFGAVFSGSIIFYSKSASLGSSWPFLLALLILMLGTEFRKNYFEKLVFQINFYFVALFSYVVVLIPVLTGKMGPVPFIFSSVVALLLIIFFIYILYGLNKQKISQYIKNIKFGILGVFLLFNFLYFTNIIPPIPLSLKFSSVYHNVYRASETSYVGIYESNPWWNIFRKRSHVIHRDKNESVYVFSSVFAPTKLNTEIFHQWQYFDDIKNEWVKTDRIRIPVSGGREDGFRGYSKKGNLFSGRWRVVIETDRGQRLGQINFRLKPKKEGLDLVEEIL